jgi:hypothetical protein
MVIGLGTGSSAGWLAALPEMERVDVVELEPAILEVARRCTAVNCDVMTNPKARIHVGDAREVLITTPERYDLIISEPSNPYRAGIASLFTYDFYQSAKQRLNRGGIFAQWMQAYDVHSDTLQTVFATVSAAFPYVQTWRTKAKDLMLIASDEPLTIDADLLRQRSSSDVVKAALFNAWRTSSVDGILAHFVANEDLVRMARDSGQEIATDDRNPLEYGFARSIGRRMDGNVPQQVVESSRARKCDRPKHVRGEFDWNRVDSLAPVTEAVEERFPRPVREESQNRRDWRLFVTYHGRNEYDKAMQLANAQKLEATEAMEIELLAESAVFAKDPSAEQWIEKCAQFHPLAATALRACLAATRQEGSAAADGLVKTFEGCRVDPWLRPTFLRQVLNTARSVASTGKDPLLARRLCDALAQPFAADVMRDDRWMARIEIAKLSDGNRFNPQLRDALEPYGRYPAWSHEFLSERLLAYHLWKDPRAIDAADDLRRFLENRFPEFGSTFGPASAKTETAEEKASEMKAVASGPTPSTAPQ